jgi:hypothetical protein
MFDNKIDWVTSLECCRVRREARGVANDSELVYIQGRAQAMICREADQASVQVRRVSLGVADGSARAELSALKADKFRLIPARTEVIRLPAARS